MNTAKLSAAGLGLILYVLVVFGLRNCDGRALKQESAAPSPSSADAEFNAIMNATDEAMMAVTPCSSVDVIFARMMLPHHMGAVDMAQWELHYGQNEQLLNLSAKIVFEQTAEISQLEELLTQVPMPADCSSGSPSMDMHGVHMRSSMDINMNMGMDMGMTTGAEMDPSMAPTPMSDGISALMDSMDSMMNMNSMGFESMSSDSSMSPDMQMSPSAMSPAVLSGNIDSDYAIEMIMHHKAAVQMAEAEIQYGSFPPLIALARQIADSQTAEIAQFESILTMSYFMSF